MERFDIIYHDSTVSVNVDYENGDSLFTVHLQEEDVYLKMNDLGQWIEYSGIATERATELGRKIQEYDGR